MVKCFKLDLVIIFDVRNMIIFVNIFEFRYYDLLIVFVVCRNKNWYKIKFFRIEKIYRLL